MPPERETDRTSGGRNYPKIVRSTEYHIWTDALHGRELAHQAKNEWDRGSYVRWAVASAWTALETACGDALDSTDVGRRLKDQVDAAMKVKGLQPLDWGSGLWQRVLDLRKTRVGFVHLTVSQEALFPDAGVADEAISTVREAIEDIYRRAGKPSPEWLLDDRDPGWDRGRRDRASSTVIRAGVDPDDPETIRIGFITREGGEHTVEYLPPETDVDAALSDLMSRLQVPVRAVFADRGGTRLRYEELPWRGA